MNLLDSLLLGVALVFVFTCFLFPIGGLITRYRENQRRDGWCVVVEAPGFTYCCLVAGRDRSAACRVRRGHQVVHCDREFAGLSHPIQIVVGGNKWTT